MTATLLVALLVAGANDAPPITRYDVTISSADRKVQEETFQTHWNAAFEWNFNALPVKGGTPGFQTPYSGYIYPDKQGGTTTALRKYDRAFHRGRTLAVSHEKWDTTAFKELLPVKGPLLGLTWGKSMRTPDWHGHCNGWTAATIRHAEPQTSVSRHGVVFSPVDIKALLAELYIYNDVVDLSGSAGRVSPGLLHATIANWLGRGGHALGIEADPSKEKWNYPAFAFNSASATRGPGRVEVKMNLAYMKDTNAEYQESPKIDRIKSFHYMLRLNSDGQIVGGKFYPDSEIIDLVWLPLRPKQGRQPGNESGNPYIDADEILAIWRESVPAEMRHKWLVIDPPAEDRQVVVVDANVMVPAKCVATIADPADEPDAGVVAESDEADNPPIETAMREQRDREPQAATEPAADDSDAAAQEADNIDPAAELAEEVTSEVENDDPLDDLFDED